MEHFQRLPQYATEAVLRRRAAELGEIELLYGWSVEDARQDDHGVDVDIAERRGEGRRRLRAEYAVGCDGSRWVMRERAGITQTGSDHDRLMVLVVFRSKGLHRLLLERFPGKSYFDVLHPQMLRWGAAMVLVRPDEFIAWTDVAGPADPVAVLRRATGQDSIG